MNFKRIGIVLIIALMISAVFADIASANVVSQTKSDNSKREASTDVYMDLWSAYNCHSYSISRTSSNGPQDIPEISVRMRVYRYNSDPNGILCFDQTDSQQNSADANKHWSMGLPFNAGPWGGYGNHHFKEQDGTVWEPSTDDYQWW